MALIEIDGFRYSDLQAFASCFGLPVPPINGYGVGLKHPLAPGGETTLDLEVLDAAAPGLKEVDVYESQARAADVLEALTAPLQNRGHVPDVISASLGTCEPALAICDRARAAFGRRKAALALAAASGISVLAASGDDGSSACVGRDGPTRRARGQLPGVIAVRDRRRWDQRVADAGQHDRRRRRSGTTPPYDRDRRRRRARAACSSGPPTRTASSRRAAARFRTSRCSPTSLPGYDIYCSARECTSVGGGNPWIAVGGTSAASPLLAGGLALVDQLLREHGRQDLGLANSLLYQVRAPLRRDRRDRRRHDQRQRPRPVHPGRQPQAARAAARPVRAMTTRRAWGSVDLGKLALLATVAAAAGRERRHLAAAPASGLEPPPARETDAAQGAATSAAMRDT